MRVALIGCGKKKQDEPAPAGELYTSGYFDLKKSYEEEVCDTGFILSAKHGVVPTREVLEPYDISVEDYPLETDSGEHTVEDWAGDVIDSIENILKNTPKHSSQPVEELVLLAGRTYRDPLYEHRPGLKEVAAKYGAEVRSPFERDDLGGFGEQMSFLKNQVERARGEG